MEYTVNKTKKIICVKCVKVNNIRPIILIA